MNYREVELILGNSTSRYLVNTIESIDWDIQLPNSPESVAGYGYLFNNRQGERKGNLKYTQFAFYDDPMITIAENGDSLYGLVRNRGTSNGIEFFDGFITSYDLSIQQGSYPKSSISVEIYGDMGYASPSTVNSNATYPTPTIVNPQSIILTKGGTRLRASSFDLSIKIPIKKSSGLDFSPSTALNSNNRVFYKNGPIEKTISFSLVLPEIEMSKLSAELSLNHDFAIELRDRVGLVKGFTLNDFYMVSNSRRVSASEDVTSTFSFVRHE